MPQLMKYRSRTEITTEILEAAKERLTKTQIMYKAYLSYSQLKEYLALLTENQLLSYEQAERVYRTTEKGIKLVATYQKMNLLTGDMKIQA